MMGRGINHLVELPGSSPSARPSPIKGEGVFLTFYEIIIFEFCCCFGFRALDLECMAKFLLS